MTAGQVGANRLGTPHRDTRFARRAAIGSVVVVIGLAVVLGVSALVVNSGPEAAAVPSVAAPVAAAPAAATMAAPAPALAPPSVFVPSRVNREQPPVQPGRGQSWGRFAY